MMPQQLVNRTGDVNLNPEAVRILNLADSYAQKRVMNFYPLTGYCWRWLNRVKPKNIATVNNRKFTQSLKKLRNRKSDHQ